MDWLVKEVCIPILEAFLSLFVQHLGPRATAMEELALQLSEPQRAVLLDLEELGKLYARKPSVSTTLRRAMQKAVYWLGTSIIGNHAGAQLFPHALRGTPPTWTRDVADATFCASVSFMHRRYLYGQAVLGVCVEEQSWLGRESPQLSDPSADLVLLLKVLRGSPGPAIGQDQVVRELTLKRVLRLGSPEQRHSPAAHRCVARAAPAAPHGHACAGCTPEVPRGEPARDDAPMAPQTPRPPAPVRHSTTAQPRGLPGSSPGHFHRPQSGAALLRTTHQQGLIQRPRGFGARLAAQL